MMKNYLLRFVFLCTVLFSCKERQEPVSNTSKTQKALGKVNTDSTAPPVVIPFTQAAAKLSPVITLKPTTLHENVGKEVITSLSSETGLPLGNYRQVLQDDRGNFWMYNSNELVKYDGHSFYTYKPQAKEFFILKIFIDKHNNIWVAGQVGGLRALETSHIIVYYFDGYSFHPVPGLQMEFPNIRFRNFSINQGPDKRIWITNPKENTILIYDGLQLAKTINLKENQFKSINNISFLDSNTIWLTDGRDTSLTRYDGSQFIKYSTKDGLPDAYFWTAIPLTNDSLYLNTDQGLYRYQNKKSIKLIDSTASAGFLGTGLLADRQSGIWARYNNGNVVKHSANGIVVFGKEDGADGIFSFHKDNQGNIWAGTRNKLLRFYKPVVNFRDIFPNNKNERIHCYLQDKKGNYWFGTWESGISRYDGKLITNFSMLRKPANKEDNLIRVESIAQDNNENIWMNNFSGSLVKFDGQNFTDYSKLGSSVFPVRPYGLFIDSKNNIWFTIHDEDFNSKGVGYFNGKETVCYGMAQGLPDKMVTCIYEDSKGKMWFGTGNGLSCFDGKSFTNYSENDGLPDNYVQCILEDGYGRLWIGTDDGLSRFDGEKFVNYSKEDGISSENIGAIQKSLTKEQLWLTTRAGITAMHFHAADSVSFENLDELNGFPIKNFPFLVDRDGALWTSDDRNSLKRIDYNKIKANAKPFTIHLSNIRINNVSLCWNYLLPENKKDSLALEAEMQHRFGKVLQNDALNEMKKQFGEIKFDSLISFDFIPANLVLPFSTNAVSFEFAAIEPQFSKYTRYQYMLEGFDKTWSPLSRNTNANFGKLTEGSYIFTVKALNIYGLRSEMSYSFKVLPPWYRTWWAYALYILTAGMAIYTFIRWRTKALQSEKILLEEKVTTRTSELNQSLENLKATQSQLIQAEKMASLGELTAGIAHEIQNPLNFINNFSDVNKELLGELKDEIKKGNLDEVATIAEDVISNEEKINHHGKRADAIVKGMLQHSRSSSATKEPTDINKLADEYLRLAYHGLRAKDKSFNATMKTDFDETIGNINVIPQDIGRVILNLITNAFYAVNEKSKQNIKGYEPTVTIATSSIQPPSGGRAVQIKVSDNGGGIPQRVLDKIFQPFFTTKPSGQGTGLGLSLSYDIVKAHGGELKVKTKEARPDDPAGSGLYTEFTIILPI